MSDNRIKPCPFCGKAANIRQAPDVTHIYCATPACVAPLASAYSDGEAVAIWNRRMVEDELQDALDGMRGIAQQRQKRVEELEAQLAKTWQPVEDGEYTADIALDKITVEGDLLVVTEHEWGDKTEIATVELPDNLRLCRRVREGGQ